MKQFSLLLIFLVLAMASALAQTIKTEMLVAAPQGVFMTSYHMHDNWDSTWEVPLFDSNEVSTLDWQNGAGGLGMEGANGQTTSLFLWPTMAWPQWQSAGIIWSNWIPAGAGSWSVVTNSPYTGPEPEGEHCDASESWPTGDEQRTADAEYKLATGGPQGSTQPNLWCISASATAYTNLSDTVGTPIPPQEIAIGSLGNLDTNGNLYALLPDNDHDDITPKVNGTDFYKYLPLAATEYKPTITANGTAIDPGNFLSGGPEFCVGQQVTMAVNWQPALPSGVVVKYNWFFQPDYVNQIVDQGTNQSLLETINAGLKTNNPTSLWWYGGGVKLAGCNFTLATTNGQTIGTFSAHGFVSIYTPTITFIDNPPSWVTNAVVDGTFSLSLGDGNHGSMDYEVDVLSKYKGRSDLTQLIDRSAANGNTSISTSGQYWMDNKRFYTTQTDGPNGGFTVTTNSPYPLYFTDGPHLELAHSAFNSITSIYDQFEDYVIFRPDAGNPSDNIYVTLGVVSGGKPSWSWSAATTYSDGTWSTPSYYITRPTDPDSSDNFPTWLHTYKN